MIQFEDLTFFQQIFDALNRQNNHVFYLAVFLCVAVGVMALRVLARVRFGAAVVAVAKEESLKNREDVKKIRCKLLRNAVAAYKQVADVAVTRIPTAQIVARCVDKMHFAGWRYGGLTAFVEGFEAGLLWVGLILAVVFPAFSHVYGVAAVAVFILLRLCATFFDFRAMRERLCDDMYIFIEREVGRFYASDAGGAVLRLKNELTEAQGKQTEAISAALQQLTVALEKNAASLNTTLTNNARELETRITTDFAESADTWRNALDEAATVQNAINTATTGIEKAGNKLQSAAELLTAHLQGHSNALSEQLLALVRAVESVKDVQAALSQQGEYIAANQKTLDETLHTYEATLQTLTQSMGDSLGTFVNLHAQNSAQAVNDALRNNIEKIMQLARQNSQGGERP